ncbi:aspartate aminotransferase [Periconia macrospinosa]|uniref:Aspartate aminotransferase n=1 Tax=Periconia macrospinosa TaxID=97972 RepID=A0A2V1DW87_9PLEO|nr:aspartate aminotransferase [Periconia macrospinosa]
MSTTFISDTVPEAPQDPLFSVTSAFYDDPSDKKIDLSIGAYRDGKGKVWVLPVVKKAAALVALDPEYTHEYLPITGLVEFTDAARKVCLGAESGAIKERRVTSLQTVSGTGALHLGALFLSKFYRPNGIDKPPTIYVSSPTWSNHPQILGLAHLPIATYRYFDAANRSLDFAGMLADIASAPPKSVILLHACAHNPTGIDPSPAQWKQLASVMAERHHFAFFDSAYQGFASGSLDRDAAAIRLFASYGFEMCIAQSFAKNCGIYGQRVGCFHFITSPALDADVQDTLTRVGSQLALLQRACISNPPVYGARVVSLILNTPELFDEWAEDLRVMSGRILHMRQQLRIRLEQLGTPGSWQHITDQIGMFSFTGLTEEQCLLMQRAHIYMPLNGRISMAGLNLENLEYFVRAMDRVVRETAGMKGVVEAKKMNGKSNGFH